MWDMKATCLKARKCLRMDEYLLQQIATAMITKMYR